MKYSVMFWVRRCYACHARKSPRHTVLWPLISLPLPSQPGQMVSFDLLGPLPRTEKGSTYIFLTVDLFSRHAEAYAMAKEQKTAEGYADLLVHDYIPRWGCPHAWLSDRGTEFTAKVARVVYEMLGAVERNTSMLITPRPLEWWKD